MPKKKTYSELLQDPLWQKKRLEVFEKYGWKCFDCRDEKNKLNVHHTYYKKGRLPWDYPITAYKVLCDICHDIAHGRNKPKEDKKDLTAEYCKKVIPSIVDLFAKFPPNNFLSRILDRIVERSER